MTHDCSRAVTFSVSFALVYVERSCVIAVILVF